MEKYNYYDILKLIETHKKERLENFYQELKKFNFENIHIETHGIYCVNHITEEMEHVETPKKIPHNFETLKEITEYLLNLQKSKGGIWRYDLEVETKKDNREIFWFFIEVGETFLDHDFALLKKGEK